MSAEIKNGPENITVIEGDSADFNCTSNSTEVPFWIIDGEYHSVINLPPRHSFHRPMLTVSSVKVSDNGRTYQCFVIDCLSSIATLTVISQGEQHNQVFKGKIRSSYKVFWLL